MDKHREPLTRMKALIPSTKIYQNRKCKRGWEEIAYLYKLYMQRIHLNEWPQGR